MNPEQLPGKPLNDYDFQALERCYITREIAETACLRRVTDVEGRMLVGANGRRGDFSGIAIPYVEISSGNVRAYRLRRDHPDLEEKDGRLVEKAKYLSAPGQGNLLYLIPWVEPDWLSDTTLPIVIVEGEKKALALWSVGWSGLGDAAERPDFLPIGLSGVWSFRGRVGRSSGPDGRRKDVFGVIPDLRRVAWQGRAVVILFDSNIHTNPQVQEARRQLAGWLTEQGAKVRLADLPREQGINGPDDAAAKHGPEYVLKIMADAVQYEGREMRPVLTPGEKKIVLEQPYRGWIRDYEKYAHSRLRSVPIEYHKLTGLTLEAGVIAEKLETDSRLRPTIAGLIVALQGSGKSLPSMIARDLIDPIEAEERAKYEQELAECRLELKMLESKPSKSKSNDDAERELELREELRRLEKGGRPAIIIATQASVEGLLEALCFTPCGIVDYDEFGAFLKDCRREHMRSARENFIKALDGRPIYYRRTQGKSVDVASPSLSIWGTINVESLRLAATDEDMFGGLFSRVLFCAPDYNFEIPAPCPGDLELASALTGRLRQWRAMAPVGIEFEEGARERSESYAYSIAPFSRGERVNITQPEDQVASVAYVRYHTHAQKVAILIAAGESLDRPAESLAVTMRHMLLAIDLVERFRQQALRLLRHLETRDPLIVDADLVLAKIRRYAGRDRGYYQRAMHWSAEKFGRAMFELEHSRQVNWSDEQSTGGKKRRVYFPVLTANHANP